MIPPSWSGQPTTHGILVMPNPAGLSRRRYCVADGIRAAGAAPVPRPRGATPLAAPGPGAATPSGSPRLRGSGHARAPLERLPARSSRISRNSAAGTPACSTNSRSRCRSVACHRRQPGHVPARSVRVMMASCTRCTTAGGGGGTKTATLGVALRAPRYMTMSSATCGQRLAAFLAISAAPGRCPR